MSACVRGALLKWRLYLAPSVCIVFQNLKQQYYTGYTENEVLEVMQHMAKNVVRVNENLTKFIVSTFLSCEKHWIIGFAYESMCIYVCLFSWKHIGICESLFYHKL